MSFVLGFKISEVRFCFVRIYRELMGREYIRELFDVILSVIIEV